MKVAIIGGAGARVPLLTRALCNADLGVSEVALYDVDVERQARVCALATAVSGSANLRAYAELGTCLNGASFVFTSVRAGGLAQRVADETKTLQLGLIAQETIGPVGFAKALRTVPIMMEYARAIAQHAPRAWVINFTNPVSIVTQAMVEAAPLQLVGICDTPTELFAEVAHALSLPWTECHFDYLGLNHLGWLKEVYYQGQPQLEVLWKSKEKLQSLYRTPLFDVEMLQKERCLPSEYVYYYLYPERALANLQSASQTRGQNVFALTNALFEDLKNPAVDAVTRYVDYLNARDASYMALETGHTALKRPSVLDAVTGYDKIGLAVMRAICKNTNEILPLDVCNQGNFSFLHDADVVEVPCVVTSNGALPLRVSGVPPTIRSWMERIKIYERLTIEAARERSLAKAVNALTAHPLIPNEAMAIAVVNTLGPFW